MHNHVATRVTRKIQLGHRANEPSSREYTKLKLVPDKNYNTQLDWTGIRTDTKFHEASCFRKF